MSAKPVVKVSTMKQEMQDMGIMAGQDAISNFTTEQEIATAIKKQFEGKYQSVWHCFVGRNFGTFVTHESTKFIYFYIGQMGICVFATA